MVGVVEDKGGDFYKVNIFAGAPALLDRLAFDGATKRNKPELRRGDVLYARVTMADRDLDTSLSCMVTTGPKKDWSSGECVSGFVMDMFLFILYTCLVSDVLLMYLLP